MQGELAASRRERHSAARQASVASVLMRDSMPKPSNRAAVVPMRTVCVQQRAYDLLRPECQYSMTLRSVFKYASVRDLGLGLAFRILGTYMYTKRTAMTRTSLALPSARTSWPRRRPLLPGSTSYDIINNTMVIGIYAIYNLSGGIYMYGLLYM